MSGNRNRNCDCCGQSKITVQVYAGNKAICDDCLIQIQSKLPTRKSLLRSLVEPFTLWRFDCGIEALVYEIEDSVLGNEIVKVLFGDNKLGFVYMSEFRQATKIG